MTQFKYELYYFSAYFERCVKLNRRIKIAIAIASSSAIAAWTQWTQLSFLWGLIIVIGQLIGAINEYLPYQQRIKELSEMQPELNALYIEIERKWFDVGNGNLTEEEINALCYDQMTEWEMINKKYFAVDTLPPNEK